MRAYLSYLYTSAKETPSQVSRVLWGNHPRDSVQIGGTSQNCTELAAFAGRCLTSRPMYHGTLGKTRTYNSGLEHLYQSDWTRA